MWLIGKIMIGILIFFGGLIFLSLVVSFIDFVFIPHRRFKKIGKIRSVNGITDNDTGFLAQGSTTTTTLLFNDGEMITFNTTIPILQLNKKCELTYTKTRVLETLCFEDIKFRKLRNR